MCGEASVSTQSLTRNLCPPSFHFISDNLHQRVFNFCMPTQIASFLSRNTEDLHCSVQLSNLTSESMLSKVTSFHHSPLLLFHPARYNGRECANLIRGTFGNRPYLIFVIFFFLVIDVTAFPALVFYRKSNSVLHVRLNRPNEYFIVPHNVLHNKYFSL